MPVIHSGFNWAIVLKNARIHYPETQKSGPFVNTKQNLPDSEQYTVIEGHTLNGKPCRIVDKTRTVDRKLLGQLLEELIASKQFGLNKLSSTDGKINLDQPQFSHIQLGEDLYRLLLFTYEAHIEKF